MTIKMWIYIFIGVAVFITLVRGIEWNTCYYEMPGRLLVRFKYSKTDDYAVGIIKVSPGFDKTYGKWHFICGPHYRHEKPDMNYGSQKLDGHPRCTWFEVYW